MFKDDLYIPASKLDETRQFFKQSALSWKSQEVAGMIFLVGILWLLLLFLWLWKMHYAC